MAKPIKKQTPFVTRKGFKKAVGHYYSDNCLCGNCTSFFYAVMMGEVKYKTK